MRESADANCRRIFGDASVEPSSMIRNLKSANVCAKTLSTAARRYFSPLCTAIRTQTQGGEVFMYGDRRPFRTAAAKMGQPPRLTPLALHRITMAKYR